MPVTSPAPEPAPTPTSTPTPSAHQPAPSAAPLNGWRRIALILAGACIVATWLYLVLTQPSDSSFTGLADSRSTTIALAGFTAPALAMLMIVIPRLPARSLALMPVALVVNIVLGQLVGTMGLPLPLYLDSIGTVLVGALAGPAAGLVTGVLSALIWGTINPTVVCFAATYAFVGAAAGWIARRGWWTGRWWPIALASLIVGFISALLSAPVASFIFGGTAGTGTGLLVSAFRSLGADPMLAVFLQSWTSDPLDKLIVFTLVWLVVRALPQRSIRAFLPDAAPARDA